MEHTTAFNLAASVISDAMLIITNHAYIYSLANNGCKTIFGEFQGIKNIIRQAPVGLVLIPAHAVPLILHIQTPFSDYLSHNPISYLSLALMGFVAAALHKISN